MGDLTQLVDDNKADIEGTEPVVRIKGGVKFEVSGDFVQGGGAIFKETPTMANNVVEKKERSRTNS